MWVATGTIFQDAQVRYQKDRERERNIAEQLPKKDAPAEVLVKASPVGGKRSIPATEVSRVMYKVHGFWPFDFYPDELIIEDKRIIIKQHLFPFGTTVDTISIQDLSVFELMHSVFFSAIHIQGGKMSPIISLTIKWLFPKEAQRAKDIVDGLLLQESESFELQRYDRKSVVNTLQAIGRS